MADPNGALKKRIVEYMLGVLGQTYGVTPTLHMVREITDSIDMLVGGAEVPPPVVTVAVDDDERTADINSPMAKWLRAQRVIRSLEDDLRASESRAKLAENGRNRYRAVLVEIYAVGKTAIDKEVRDGS